MSFDGTEGGQITLAEGAAMTLRYRTENPGAIKARYFGKDCINQLLAQSGVMGIRMYYAVNAANEPELVLVGVDANGNDLTQLVMDLSRPCPKHCSETNVLNS